jgi:hypothetical protein
VQFAGIQEAPYKHFTNLGFMNQGYCFNFLMMCWLPKYNPLLNIVCFSLQVIRAGLDHGQAEGYKAGDHLDFYCYYYYFIILFYFILLL